MTGKVLESNPKGLLVLILPLAVGMVLVYEAWRIILLVAFLLLGYIAWDSYQWQQKCQQIDPLFNQLIKTNQGKITQADLVMAGIAKGRAANRYLQGKADEYGAYQRTVQGVNVYYFITASTLGSILDGSEPESESASELPHNSVAEMPLLPSTSSPAIAVSSPVLPESSSEAEKEPAQGVEKVAETLTEQVAEVVTETVAETVTEKVTETVTETVAVSPAPQTSPFASLVEIKEERKQQTDLTPSPAETPQASALLLIQADLAKRLDTTSSTIARRKTEPDFTEWSQTKDPDGLAWCYDADSKMFRTV